LFHSVCCSVFILFRFGVYDIPCKDNAFLPKNKWEKVYFRFFYKKSSENAW